ncbi:sigma-70 family RNA polymerase sigma factor [Aliirhizobium smilacinae]|uniref:Sigma-70 family RNA polymerase sigma factor n=2 Tax=Aliirhizobium smilacinae TaxID=1395944 RepID=A0A5C4XGD7_9HYPH|nr:sigma-70 family RNA polymerase sigma factor [Rhizobium smilacinae]
MNLSISISLDKCQKRRPSALRLTGHAAHRLGMNKKNSGGLIADDLAKAEMVRLLSIVGRERSVDAFEAIFRFYAPRIRSFMAAKTKDRQAAEELMQETMTAVWNKAGQFDPARGNVSAWIYTIARNVRIDAYRRKRPEFDFNDPAFVADDVAPADQEFQQLQEAQLLRGAMATLPEEQLDVLRRAFFDDASHSTIARDLGVPLGTVKSRIRLAFEKLRSTLEGRL